MLSSILKILVLVILADRLDAAERKEMTCKEIQPTPGETILRTCETSTSYIFETGGDLATFDKATFQRRLVEAVKEWWNDNQLSTIAFAGGAFDIWVTLPDSSPSAFQLRAILHSSYGRIAFGFDPRSSDWHIEDANVGILQSLTYPDSFGFRPKEILLSVNPNSSRIELESIVQKAGLTLDEDLGNGWYSANSKVFYESKSIQRLRKLDKNNEIIKSAQTNKVLEWVGYRSQAFKFQGAYHE